MPRQAGATGRKARSGRTACRGVAGKRRARTARPSASPPLLPRVPACVHRHPPQVSARANCRQESRLAGCACGTAPAWDRPPRCQRDQRKRTGPLDAAARSSRERQSMQADAALGGAPAPDRLRRGLDWSPGHLGCASGGVGARGRPAARRARPDRPHPAKERRRAPEGPLLRAAADAACCAGSCRTPASPAAAYASAAGATYDLGAIRDRCIPPPAACRPPSTAAGQSSSAAGGARPAGAAFMSARAVRLQRAGRQNGRARPAILQRLFGGARDHAWADTRPRGSPARPRATGETEPPLESWAPKAVYSPRRTGFPEKTPS